MILSKKKRNVIIVVTALLFFGTLLFNLKYPLMPETSAEPGKIAQENVVNDSEDGGTDTVNKNSKAVDKLDEKDQAQEKDSSEDEVKLDANTDDQTANSGGDKSSSSNKSSSGNTSSGKSSGGSSAPSTPKTEPKPAPKPEPKPEPKPAPKPAPKPEPKPEPKPAPKPAPKPEPKPEPKPTLKPFIVPASNSFCDVYQSTDPDRAELLIVMDSSNNYEVQLNELYNVIAPVVGSSLANQIKDYAETKTDAYISLDRSWSVSGRTLELGSTWGSWGVSFYSWRK
jgi:hypothetical protein